MKTGVYFDLRNPPPWRQDSSRIYGFTLEMCEEAERQGASSVWLSEHHLFSDGYLPQPLTFAAAIAARTKRLRIGTAIMLAPLRTVAHVAEEAAVVDLISDGRLELGLGAGYRLPEFELYGADMKRRYAATDACARELRAIWAEGRVTPAPVQERLPIWMGYMGPKSARRAGLLGEGLLSLAPSLYQPYLAGLAEAGHDPSAARMAGAIQGWISEDPEGDWAVVSQHLKYQLESYREGMVEGLGRDKPRPIDPERIRARGLGDTLNGFLLASPEQAARQIREYLGDIPVETIFIFASLANTPEEMTARHVQAICKLGRLLDED